MRNRNLQKGIGLVEIVVAVFILTIVLSVLITVNNLYIKSSSSNIKSSKAAYLASEGIEAIKTIRDSGWVNISAISTSTNHYLYFDNLTSRWTATNTVEIIPNDFFRRFVTTDVYRDSQGDISSLGTFDPYTKKIEVYISWENTLGQGIEKKITTYVSNIFE